MSLLDPQRQQRAAERARRYESDAGYHETQARQARESIATIVRTWNLDPVTLQPLPQDPPVCGGEYHHCSGCPNRPS